MNLETALPKADWISMLLAAKLGMIILWAALWFGWERLFPQTQRRFAGIEAARRWGKNAALFALNSLASPLIVLPLTAWAAAEALAWRPDAWSGVSGLLLDLLILDAFIYAWHRANHTLPFLWRFHQIHHLDQDLDVTSAVRFHLGEVLLSAFVRAGFIFLMDMPLSSVLIFEILLLCASLFHHSNARLPSGFEKALSLLVITPSLHWVHHHAVRTDTDSNYGLFLSFWDRLFGSRSQTLRQSDFKIGVEDEKDLTLKGLLLRPLKAP